MMNIIMRMKAVPNNVYNKLLFLVRKVKTGDGLLINGRLFVRGKGKIIIGKNVTINSSRESNPIGGDTKTILYAKEGSIIKIGNGVGISNSAIVSMKEIVIEDLVYIGGNCKIYDHDFHSIDFEERISDIDNGIKSAPIIIKKGAFIGGHSIVLKGVTIGEKSVIGAGSVVTKNIPDCEIWAGNPAKFISKNISSEGIVDENK